MLTVWRTRLVPWVSVRRHGTQMPAPARALWFQASLASMLLFSLILDRGARGEVAV